MQSVVAPRGVDRIVVLDHAPVAHQGPARGQIPRILHGFFPGGEPQGVARPFAATVGDYFPKPTHCPLPVEATSALNQEAECLSRPPSVVLNPTCRLSP